MMRFQKMILLGLILVLTQSCSSLKQSQKHSQTIQESEKESLSGPGDVVYTDAPKLPIFIDKAFLPLRRDKSGKIAASYQWRICKKKFIWCIEWEPKRVFFYDLEWFLSNGWGLSKRKKP